MSRAAYVDESYGAESGGVYVLAAVMAAPDDVRCRAEMTTVLRPRMVRTHFAKDSESQRLRVLAAVGRLAVPLRAFVAVGAPNPERTRAKLIECLAWTAAPDVGEVVFESRGVALDRRDGRTLAHVHRTGGPHLSYRHVPATTDALLWAADALAGALYANYARGITLYADLLAESVEVTLLEA